MTDEYFMERALDRAGQALAEGEFPVGCVISDGRRVVVSGARRGSAGRRPNELDHAEIIALRRLYENGDVEGLQNKDLTIYSTMEPCLMCFGAILLNQISRVVYAYEDVMGGGTRINRFEMPALYARSRVSVVSGVLREKSLALFQTYFADPRHAYWKDSLLAQYTLSQD